MADIKLSQVVGSGGGSAPSLAPDLTFPTKIRARTYAQTSGIDTSVGLTEVLGLSGKFIVSLLLLTNMTNSDLTTIKLTVDGVVIWSDTNALTGTNIILLGGELSSGTINYVSTTESITVNSSLSLEIETAAGTATTLRYNVRPIL